MQSQRRRQAEVDEDVRSRMEKWLQAYIRKYLFATQIDEVVWELLADVSLELECSCTVHW